MECPKKFKFPREVYRGGILYYTIVGYHYNDPESKICKMGIFKSGWIPDIVHNYSHPIHIRAFEMIKKRQEELRRQTIPDWEQLNKIYFTI